MSNSTKTSSDYGASTPADSHDATTMPAQWLFAAVGKRVVHPGGRELTEQLLQLLAIQRTDDVVELAPGAGVTTRRILDREPKSYIGIVPDYAPRTLFKRKTLPKPYRRMRASTSSTGLPSGSASVVIGEALMTLQPLDEKRRIVEEIERVLKPRGRYGFHELAIGPEDIDPTTKKRLVDDLSSSTHIGTQPLTAGEWIQMIEAAGLHVIAAESRPMTLLEPQRILQDEGIFGSLSMAWNLIRQPTVHRRMRKMRDVFNRHQQNLSGLMLIAQKP